MGRSAASLLVLLLWGCTYDVEPGYRRGVRGGTASASTAEPTSGQAPTAAVPSPAPTATDAGTPPPVDPPPEPPPGDDPGPAPPGCTGIQKDANGFFSRTTAQGPYVAFVPKGYAGKPTRLVVGLHGCGDNPMNFATWAVAPWATRDQQDWIAISVGGETGGGKCWSMADGPIVLAAIADISTCFYVHQHKVVLAGYSSGGELAYHLGLTQAAKFAGLLVENTALHAAGNPDTLLAQASWKLPIAHTARTGDTIFGIASVRADWAKIEAAGFPLDERELAGGHDGTSDDWTGFLLPKAKAWRSP